MNISALQAAFTVFLLGMGTSLLVIAALNNDVYQGIIGFINLLTASMIAYNVVVNLSKD